MRRFAKVAATLLLGALAANANAHIEFIKARFLTLTESAAGRWTLELEIHQWMNGRRDVKPPRRVTLQFGREPGCILEKDLYLGTEAEFAEAVQLIAAQMAAGGLHTFGLNASRVDESGIRYLSPNLRVGKVMKHEGPLVWAVARQASGVRCPLKYVANR
jgi:hypothetical protein